MARYIRVEEVTILGIKAQMPRSRWTDEELAANKCERLADDFVINTGDLLIQMLTHPMERVMQQDGSVTYREKSIDFAQMRLVEEPLDYLDANGDGFCDLPLGSWAQLETAWYDLIWSQAKDWPFNSVIMTPQGRRAILGLIRSWEKASDVKPVEMDDLLLPGALEDEQANGRAAELAGVEG